MARYPEIPDHPEIARTLRTGHLNKSKSVECTDCQQKFCGNEKMYIDKGEVVCGYCMKNRLLDTYSIADLAEAFDIASITAEAHLAEQEGL